MKAKFTDFTTESNWVSGKCDKYHFEAKLFDEGSEYGINGGRVSKLFIADDDDYTLVNYDRGWDVEPSVEMEPYYEEIMKLLENSPKRFEDE
jgi:hypothetical protein